MDKQVSQSRIFRRGKLFDYLEDVDRFLAADPEPDLRYGIIGCGMMGQEHIRNTVLVGRASIGGLFDTSPKSVDHALETVKRLQKSQPTVYNSLEEACADPTTDALIIATPNYTHLDVLRVATQHGKAIFLEKPIATSITDAFEVYNLAKSHSHTVRFGLQYRYKAVYAEAINEVFERNSAGHVHSVSMLEHRFPFLDKVGQWNKFDATTGGTLVEKCCHYFDLINLFAGGRPEVVYAAGNQAVNFREFTYNNQPADGIDQAQVTINYDNGVIGSFSLCMFAPGSREELIVCGDQGRVLASEQALLGQENVNQLEIWRGENGASVHSTPSYAPYIAKAGHHGSTFYEHIAFANEATQTGNTAPNLEDGLWSVLVGAAAQTSIERKAAVTIEELLPPGITQTLTSGAHTHAR